MSVGSTPYWLGELTPLFPFGSNVAPQAFMLASHTSIEPGKAVVLKEFPTQRGRSRPPQRLDLLPGVWGDGCNRAHGSMSTRDLHTVAKDKCSTD